MKPPNEEAEDTLISAARRGDQDAFEVLVRRYEKRVYALTLRMCGNPDDAAEAAQEALLSAWQGLPFFRGDSGFSTWLYRLTSNACVDFLRRDRRRADSAGPSLDDEERNLELPDPARGPADELERRELREDICRGLSALPPEYREVLVLREVHQLSYGEIAESLDLDLGTVKSRINRGRKQLCAFLQESGNFFAASASKRAEKEGCK